MKLTATVMNYDEVQPVGFPCQTNCGRDAMAAVEMHIGETTWRIWACVEDAQKLESELASIAKMTKEGKK